VIASGGRDAYTGEDLHWGAFEPIGRREV
jgi:hypothetical protein